MRAQARSESSLLLWEWALKPRLQMWIRLVFLSFLIIIPALTPVVIVYNSCRTLPFQPFHQICHGLMIDSEIVLLKFKGLLNKNPIKPAGIPSSHRGGWGLPQGHLKGGDKPESKAKALKESAKDIEYYGPPLSM